MDQHGEKEAEKKSQDSAEHQRQDDAAAAAAAEGDAEESVGRGAGYKAEESAGLLIKEVVSSEEAASPAALFAHPCSLLQLLLRACAGCLGLHGYCGGGSDPGQKPAAVAAPDAAAAADPSQEGEGGGEKADFVYMQEEVVTRVRAVRRPQPPGRPREGSGGNGGVHH